MVDAAGDTSLGKYTFPIIELLVINVFAVLLTALPIIFHLSTPQSYQLALAVAVVLALPSLSGLFPHWSWRTVPGRSSVPR